MRLVTPIKTQGKKTKIVTYIIEAAKSIEYEIWIEPFLGSAEVLFNVNPKFAYVSDNNRHVINFYNAIKRGELSSSTVRSFLQYHGSILSSKGKTYYYEMRDIFNKTGDPHYFLFINRSCFNGVMRFNNKGNFNVPFCNKPERFSPALITKIVNQVKKVEEILQSKGDDWTFVCCDWKDTVNLFKEKNAALMYLDPPYVNRHTTYYDDWTEEKNNIFFKEIEHIEGSFILSNWHSNQYRTNENIKVFNPELYNIQLIEHFYHVGGNLDNRNSVIECLITKSAI